MEMVRKARRSSQKGNKQALRTLILSLPSELYKHILHYLDKKSFLSARAVCTKFSTPANYLWEQFYHQCFHVVHSPIIPASLTTCPIDRNSINASSSSPSASPGKPSQNTTSNTWKDLFIERYKILNLRNSSHYSSSKSINIFKNSKNDVYYVDKGTFFVHDFFIRYNYVISSGYAFIYRNDIDKALRCFEKATKLKRSARAYEGLARIYQQRDVPSYVIIFSEAALEFKPVNQAELYYLRGKALHHYHRLDEALRDFNKSIEYLTLSPVNYHLFLRHSDVYYDRMLIHIEHGNYQLAYLDCEKIEQTERYFEGGDCWMKGGKILYDKKQFMEAERFLKQVKNKTKEYYLLFMQVKCSIGKYEKALEQYRKYQEELQAQQRHQQQMQAGTGDSSPVISPVMETTHETYLDIGITLFMNNCIQEAIDNFVNCVKLMHMSVTFGEKEIALARSIVHRAATRQIAEYCLTTSSASDDFDVTNVIDIHMAWGFYYFLVGMIFLYKSTMNSIPSVHKRRTMTPTSPTANKFHSEEDQFSAPVRSDNYELRIALTNFTRCITLNPTLSESFYYRALLQCFLLLDHVTALNTQSVTSPSSSKNLDFEMMKRVKNSIKTPSSPTSTSSSGTSTPPMSPVSTNSKLIEHRQIAQKIMITNLMREALNDVTNANTLIYTSASDTIEPAQSRYVIHLILLKSYILHCLARKQDALDELEKARVQIESLKIDHENDLKTKCFALKAVITREQEDLNAAFELDMKFNKLISCPSTEDLLSVIICVNVQSV